MCQAFEGCNAYLQCFEKTPSVCDTKTTRLALDAREGDGRHHTSHHGPCGWRVGCMGSCQGRIGRVAQQAVAMATYTSIASGFIKNHEWTEGKICLFETGRLVRLWLADLGNRVWSFSLTC